MKWEREGGWDRERFSSRDAHSTTVLYAQKVIDTDINTTLIKINPWEMEVCVVQETPTTNTHKHINKIPQHTST